MRKFIFEDQDGWTSEVHLKSVLRRASLTSLGKCAAQEYAQSILGEGTACVQSEPDYFASTIVAAVESIRLGSIFAEDIQLGSSA